MGVTSANLIQGPATLYNGLYGATEPTDTLVNTTPASSAWTDVGGTQDGVTLNVNQTYSELEVDQIVDVVGRRLTKREFGVKTNLAEATLELLALSLNDTAPTSAAGYKTFDPTNASSATQPNYFATILDGYAPGGFRRRLIGRRMLSTANVESAYQKDKQTLIPVEFAGHYVSSSIKPFHIVDQTS